ncbi:MAG: hypothetical protein IT169_17495 [Bryobacterales bacterium]|nr:hypothetical protein [Bryobacterales bacterium]
MNLAAKYNRTELIRDGEIQAWKGMDRSTGEAVVLYLYTGEVSGGQALSEVARGSLAQSLGAGETQVDGGVFGLSPCVVARVASVGMPAAPPARTPDPPVFSAPPPASAPIAPMGAGVSPEARTPVPPVAADQAHGEFTAMFGAATAGIGVPPKSAPTPTPTPAPVFTTPPPEAPASAAPRENPAPAGEPMGEFTRLFRAADSPPTPQPASDAAADAPAAPAAPAAQAKPAAPPHPGVFTSLYMAANPGDETADAPKPEPAPEKEPVTPPAPAAPPHPGEFTSLYMATAPESMPEIAMPAASAEPAKEPAAEPEVGEFTSLFMAAKPPEKAAEPAVKAETPAVPATEPAPPAFTAPEARPAESPAAQVEEPGEFTLAFRSVDLSAADAEAPKESAVPTPLPPAAPPAAQADSFDETADLQVGGLTGPADAIPAVPADAEPGEFTRLFEAAPEEAAPSKTDEDSLEITIAMPMAAAPIRVEPAADLEEPAAAVEEPAAVLEEAISQESAEIPEAAEAERFSSASPAKGPIRFVASEKSADETAKPARNPLQSGSFSQTYVSTGEMPVMREPNLVAPAAPPAAFAPPAAGGEEPGEFTMLFASPDPAPPADSAPGAAAPVAPAASITPAVPAAPPSPPAAAAAATPVEKEKPAMPGQEPGEFTKFFQPGDVDKIKQEVAAMGKPAASAPDKNNAAPEPPVGEFTRMFSAAEMASKTEKPKDPGIFTNLYMAAEHGKLEQSAPAAPAAPIPSATPAPAEAGGSFTSMFRAAEGGVVPSAPAPAGADAFMPPVSGGFTPPQSPAMSEEPSFTRYFQAGDLPAAPVAPQHQDVVAPSPDLPAYSSGYSKGATSFFQAVPEPAAPAAPVEQGPGEYTRMISGDEVKQAMANPGGQPGTAPAGAAGGGGGGMQVNLGVPMSAPSVSGPYVQGPRMSGPHMSGPQISSSGISGPHFQGPHVSGPYVQGPHVSTPYVGSPHVQVPPVQVGGGSPVAPGQQAPAAGGGASKIIIVATVLVTVIAVVLVLMVAYFMLKG